MYGNQTTYRTESRKKGPTNRPKGGSWDEESRPEDRPQGEESGAKGRLVAIGA